MGFIYSVLSFKEGIVGGGGLVTVDLSNKEFLLPY